MRHLIPCLLALTLISIGCPSASVQTARTNGEGTFQFGIEPGVLGVVTSGASGFVPGFNLAGRYGISDRVDIGARIGSVGYELQAKVMFTDPADTDSLAISIAPAATVIGFGAQGDSVFMARALVPVLFGLPVGDSELTLGARLIPTFGTVGTSGGSGSVFSFAIGGEAGFAARVGKAFWILPFLAVDYPLIGVAAAGGSSASTTGRGVIIQGGVGFLLGGRKTAGGEGGVDLP